MIRPLLLFLGMTLSTPAALHMKQPEDAKLVHRSEAIVVAKVEEGSVSPFSVANGPTDFRATLIVSSVLKGNVKMMELPIIIHYDLVAAVNGYLKDGARVIDLHRFSKDIPKDSITVFPSDAIVIPSTDDLRSNHIWFLETSDPEGNNRIPKALGVWVPWDIQPLDRLTHFRTFLSP
jgi:hypothetical protein